MWPDYLLGLRQVFINGLASFPLRKRVNSGRFVKPESFIFCSIFCFLFSAFPFCPLLPSRPSTTARSAWERPPSPSPWCSTRAPPTCGCPPSTAPCWTSPAVSPCTGRASAPAGGRGSYRLLRLLSLSVAPQVQLCQVQHLRAERDRLQDPVRNRQLVGLPQPGHVHCESRVSVLQQMPMDVCT